MGENKTLISIGEMSKISGINIKCLRYYDSVGILSPAWINPETGYRYYDVSQTAILEVIECGLSLDIPLKVIREFLNVDGTQDASIRSEQMCRHGLKLLEERQQKLDSLKQRMEHLQNEMTRGENVYQSSGPVKVRMRGFCHRIVPFEGNANYKNIRMHVAELLKEARMRDWKVTYNFGIIFLKKDGEWKQHLYVDLWMDREEAKKYPEITVFEEGEYVCQKISRFQSEEVLQRCRGIVDEEQIEFIEVSELFKSDNSYPNSEYEIRIRLK